MLSKSFQRCNLFEMDLQPIRAHGGQGELHFKRILTSADIKGHCNFMDFTVMPPQTTIGSHSHQQTEEEYYLILKGNGQMTRDGESFEVKPGDLVRNRPGGTHALANTGGEPLHLFVFELAVTP